MTKTITISIELDGVKKETKRTIYINQIANFKSNTPEMNLDQFVEKCGHITIQDLFEEA